MFSTEQEQLVKTVFDITGASEKWHIDPKQFEDAKLLYTIADIEKVNHLWKEHNFDERKNVLLEAIKQAEEKRNEHPEWAYSKPYHRPEGYVCPDCSQSSDFPITSFQRIYEILGYTEA